MRKVEFQIFRHPASRKSLGFAKRIVLRLVAMGTIFITVATEYQHFIGTKAMLSEKLKSGAAQAVS